MFGIFGKKSSVKLVEDGEFEKRRCPKCDETTIFREVEVDNSITAYKLVELFEWVGKAFMCEACDEIIRCDTECSGKALRLTHSGKHLEDIRQPRHDPGNEPARPGESRYREEGAGHLVDRHPAWIGVGIQIGERRPEGQGHRDQYGHGVNPPGEREECGRDRRRHECAQCPRTVVSSP